MNNIDQEQLNRTIDSALESLWVKLIEDNKYATGAELYLALITNTYPQVADLFSVWVESRNLTWHAPVGDWE